MPARPGMALSYLAWPSVFIRLAASSPVPALVEIMGLIGRGNNPMTGATVSAAVAVEEAMVKQRQLCQFWLCFRPDSLMGSPPGCLSKKSVGGTETKRDSP